MTNKHEDKLILKPNTNFHQLQEYVRNNLVIPYEAIGMKPFSTYGFFHYGVHDYWHWYEEKDFSSEYAKKIVKVEGYKPLEEATKEELWMMIAICNTEWLDMYENITKKYEKKYGYGIFREE